MHINDIEIEDVRQGKKWRVAPPLEGWTVRSIEQQANLVEADDEGLFIASDQVVYSGLMAFPSGRVKAVLLFKKVGDAEYGGVYWHRQGNSWREVGVEPDPGYELGGREFIANPLSVDPSFDAPDHDYRAVHRDGFRRYAKDIA